MTTFILTTALVLAPALAGTAAQKPAAGLPDFMDALQSTPGFLGAEKAQTASGKLVIFAWFENKKSVLAWYYSETHQHLASQFVPDRKAHTPLANIPDDGQPIMAIATITPSGTPKVDRTTLPVSQISIELYKPLPGGIALGGRFSPSTLEELKRRGHKLKVLGPYGMPTGVVAVGVNLETGTLRGAADVRRERYVFGW